MSGSGPAGEVTQGPEPGPAGELAPVVSSPASVYFRDNAYRAAREALTLAAILVAVAGVAAAFAWPWLPEPPAGGPVLAKYAPVRDGDARLMLQTTADGSVKGWLAHNTRLIPGLRIATDARKAVADAFLEAIRQPGEDALTDDQLHTRLAAITIVETRAYEVDAEGQVTESWQYFARDDLGDRFVAIYYPQASRDVVASPPALMIPARAEVGASWSGSGKLGSATYDWNGRVLSIGRYDGAAGQFDDCLQVETQLVLASGSGSSANLTRDWYCDGLGWVEGHGLEPAGDLKQRTVWLGTSGALPDGVQLPPAPPALDQPPTPAEPDRWRLTRLGRARATGETSETTILPTWLPTDPPLLLAAGFGADLVAFETYIPGAPARWRFHSDGTVYGQPAFNEATGRIYFGASDKRLHALDARGLSLWSFETEDNVAARPLVVGDLVVAASEDGKVYGLDGATGRRRWTFEADGGVVSWPARVGDTVVFGSDNGTVYGLDPESGQQRWTLAAADAVEAPIVVDEADGVVYVASRDGTLAAFKPAGCSAECKTSWSVEPGGSLRTAPLIARERVIVVDEEGELIAVSKEDGKRAWSLTGVTYVGAPVLVGDAIVVASSKGLVERISLGGQRLDGWEARTATNPADGEPAFSYGPVVGGDALWIGDTSAVIRRLGAPPLGQIPSLRLAWIDQSTRPPFTAGQLRSTIAEHDGRAIAVDYTKGVFVLDPATGSGFKLADLPGEGLLTQVDPVVVGDTLLTVGGRVMQALDLTSGQLRWQGAAPGGTIRPPAVAGQTVLWVNTADGIGSLLALDLATGALRWQANLGSVSQIGGVVAGADAAFTSTPPAAWDLQTGRQRWQANFPGWPIGGPAVAADGQMVYLSGMRAAGDGGMAVALDAATGVVRWQVDLDDALINPLDGLSVVDGVLVIPALDGKALALDAATGTERWRFEPPAGRLGGVTVARGRVWFMLENARLYGLDLQHGRPVARLTDLELNLNGQGLTQRPAFVGDRLLFPAGLSLIALELPADEP